VARSAIARDAVGALDVGGAASDTAQRPLDQCDCFDRLRPPTALNRKMRLLPRSPQQGCLG